MLLVLSILIFLAGISVPTFSKFMTTNNLEKSTAKVRGLLEEARSLTLASKYDTQYGVHFESAKAVLFQGASYSSTSATNISLTLPSSVRIGTTTLSGGGNDVVFSRQAGGVSAYGTTTLFLLANPARISSIVIYGTGLTEIK